MIGTPSQIITAMVKQVSVNADKLYEIKEHKEKRTLTQNAYYWVLLGKVAKALRMSNTELHNRMLRSFSTPELFGGKAARTLLPDTQLTEDKTLASETVHLKPTSQTVTLADGITYRTYILLKGSSAMTTDEMSALVDGLVQEAKQLGIETLTPNELEKMRQYELQAQAKQSNRHPAGSEKKSLRAG